MKVGGNFRQFQTLTPREKWQVVGMPGGRSSAGMTGGKRGNIGHVGGIQSDFGCSRTGWLRESLSFLGGIRKIGC